MNKRLVLFGGSMNPPTDAHVTFARQLSKSFDRVVVIPCGDRPDKRETGAVDPAHRANMARLAFEAPDKPRNLALNLTDLERDQFLTTVELDQLWTDVLGDGWEVWHAIGSDLIQGGADGESPIQRSWHEGPRAWAELRFVILPRAEYPVTQDDLPPRRVVMEDLGRPESSTTARNAFARGQSGFAGVPEAVAEYVTRYGLYPMALGSRRQGRLVLPENPRLFVIPAAGNERARAIMDDLAASVGDSIPDAVVAIGGDGHMLDVIGSTRVGVPIIGINAGHRGFLLNDVDAATLLAHIAAQRPFDLHLLHKLEVEMEIWEDGQWRMARRYAFNDAWLERATRQTGWVSVQVDNTLHHAIPHLACDAVLVSTPAGSTAYARAMGAPPLHLDTPMLNLAASGVADPHGWHYAMVPDDSIVTLEALDPDKRPLLAVVDGREIGTCRKMTIRRSRTANAELAFLPGHSLGAKIAALQFPATS